MIWVLLLSQAGTASLVAGSMRAHGVLCPKTTSARQRTGLKFAGLALWCASVLIALCSEPSPVIVLVTMPGILTAEILVVVFLLTVLIERQAAAKKRQKKKRRPYPG